MKKLVAVYGSLRRGLHNSYLLKGSIPLGKYVVNGFDMYSLGGFPAIIFGSGDITIELYEVDTPTFKRLDNLEGFPTFYDRTQVDTPRGSAWIYFQHEIPSKEKVDDGDWFEYLVKTEKLPYMSSFWDEL